MDLSRAALTFLLKPIGLSNRDVFGGMAIVAAAASFCEPRTLSTPLS